MRILIIMTMNFMIFQVGNGQNDSVITNALSLSPGLDYISLKDRTFSPIVFSGVASQINVGFDQNRRNKAIWQTDLLVSVGNINHENGYFESTYVAAQFSFNYLSKIKSVGKSRVYFGGQFRSVVNVLDYDGFESGGWFTAQQLEPIFLYQYTISEKQSITGQFSYPVLSYVGRPGYAGVDEFVIVNSQNVPKVLYSRMKIQSLDKLINPNFELEYTYNLAKMRFTVSANYSYLQVNSVRKYYKNEVGINFGFHLKIGKNHEA